MRTLLGISTVSHYMALDYLQLATAVRFYLIFKYIYITHCELREERNEMRVVSENISGANNTVTSVTNRMRGRGGETVLALAPTPNQTPSRSLTL